MAVLGLRTIMVTFSSRSITFSPTSPKPGGKFSCLLPVPMVSYGFLLFFSSTPLTKSIGL